MTNAALKRGDLLTRRSIRWLTTGLICLGVILVIATAYIFTNLRDRQQLIRQSVREDAMWAVFQTHREASRLVDAILVAKLDPSAESVKNVILSFDLVYSRISLLDGGFFTEQFSETEELQVSALSLQTDTREMATKIDALPGKSVGIAESHASLLEDARSIQSQSNALVVSTNERLGHARVNDRLRSSRYYAQLAQLVAAMAVVFLGTIALQFLQLRFISQTGQQLLDLSAKNSQSAKAAEAASKAKSMFLATMSHEIRTPLNGIIGAVDLLNQTELSEEQARRSLTIRRCGHALLDVINDILDFSNLDAKGLICQFAPVALPEMADILSDIVQNRVEDAGLKLEINVPSVSVVTDDVRLRQVMLNLLGNAIKFTPSGEISLTITLPRDNILRVEVKDSGIGIPVEDQPRLFQDFSQIENSASRRFGGSGLGLAISKRIILGLDGNIGVKSIAGKGSTFWFELPVSSVKPYDAPASQIQSSSRSPNTKYDVKILLVEDHPVNREIAKALFESFGATITTAENGEIALQLLQSSCFDLVVMDLQMPVMDGITATRAARNLGETVPIVGLTANAFPEDRALCIDAGMNDFVAKPVSRDKISSVLEAFFPPAPTAETQPLLDLTQLSPILKDLGADLYLDLLGQLNSDGEALRQLTQSAECPQDVTVFEAKLHSLKGAAGTMGLALVADQAQDLRTKTLIGATDIFALLTLLGESIDDAKRYVEKHVDHTVVP